MTRDNGTFSPEHRRDLQEGSSLSEEVIAARGYETVTTASRLRNLGFKQAQSNVPALLIPVFNPRGEIALYQSRPDQPRVKDGKAVKYESLAGSSMTLDVHPSVRHLLADPNAPLFITEGIKKGDSLASRDLCAIALLGVWNFRGTNQHGGKTVLPDWEYVALNGRRIYIVFDSDVMEKRAVHAALVRLKAFLESRGALVMLIYLPSGLHGEKVGVDDFLVAGHSIDELMMLATSEVRSLPSDDDAVGGEDGTQADMVVAIGRSGELFHDATGTAFTRMPVADHHEVWSLTSKRFRQWLRREFYVRTRKTPNAEAVNAACGVLEGIAVYDGPTRLIHNRIGTQDGVIHYDLADDGWRTVEVTPHGWQIREMPSVLFRRYSHQQAQVEPSRDGDIRRLFRYLNVRSEDHLLLLVWLVLAFVPDIPHPIPDFHGEKGAGKSVGQRVLRRLIDPSTVESLTFPSDIKELVQQLAHNYAPVYDNVDHLSHWLSDLLCRAVTGDGFTKRELWTDDDDVIYAYRRVVMLNGINVVARRADLLDRSILLWLERIGKQARLPEKEFWEAFEADRPLILGGIFDTLSNALRVYPEVKPSQLERMADFTRFGAAVAIALGYSEQEFLDAYAANVGAQAVEAVEGDVVGAAIRELMSIEDEWQGTPTSLLRKLEEVGEDAKLFRRNSNGKVDAKGWPGGPQILTRRVNEIRSNLLDLGIHMVESRGDDRTITLRNQTDDIPESTVGSVGSVGANAPVEGEPDDTDGTDAAFAGERGSWEMKIP